LNQVATRRLRIIKYRGTSHGTNEYPAMIDEGGLSILPITSLGLSVRASRERVTTGIAPMDAMLGGGYWRGSSILMTGTAGTGKTSFAVAFADSVCRQGGRSLYLSFEESPSQLTRNMASIGFRLSRYIRSGRLLFNSVRPTVYGLESHLVNVHALVKRFRPESVIMDPITGLGGMGSIDEIKAMLTRIIDYFKNERITAVFTSLTDVGSSFERSEVGVSTLMDTWIILRMVEAANESRRTLSILKSRGMAHSHQTREFRFNSRGIHLLDFDGGAAAPAGANRGRGRRW
jgi:circadian clock protein KaiC